jgi:hypothetical protein
LKQFLHEQQPPPPQEVKQVVGQEHLEKRNGKQFLSPQQPQLKLQLGQVGLRTRMRQQQLAVKVVVVAVFARWWAFFLGCRDGLIFLSRIFVVMFSISRMNLDRWRMKSGYSSRLQ